MLSQGNLNYRAGSDFCAILLQAYFQTWCVTYHAADVDQFQKFIFFDGTRKFDSSLGWW